MDGILALIKRNGFWLLMGLVLAGLAFLHFFVARDLARDVEQRQAALSDPIDELKTWANKPSIANSEMIRAAHREKDSLQALQGQVFLLFAPRGERFDRDFHALRGLSEFQRAHAFRWWDEYEHQRWRPLLAETRDAFDAPPAVLRFLEAPAAPRADLGYVRSLQTDFWKLKYVVGALKMVRPKDKPLIANLLSIQLDKQRGATLNHPWLRATPVKLLMRMAYKDLPKLIVALQNSPRPLVVVQYRVAKGARDGGEDAAPVSVELDCEIVEYLPAVASLTFRGRLFEKAEDIREWVREQDRTSNVVLRELAARLPELKRRIEIELGDTLEALDHAADESHKAALEELETEEAEQLEADLAAARGENRRIPPGRERAIRKAHADRLAALKQEAQADLEREKLALFGRAGGFAFVYDHLRPIVQHRAYFVAPTQTGRAVVVWRSAGRWVFAGSTGQAYPEKDEARTAITAGGRRREAPADAETADQLLVFVDRTSGEPADVLVAYPGGGWVRYQVLSTAAQPVALGDTAFRYAHVVRVAARKIDAAAFKGDKRTLEVTDRKALKSEQQLKQFEIVVQDGLGGSIEVDVGLRK